MATRFHFDFLKECFKCKRVKLLTEFYAHPQMGDGRLNKCKECTKGDAKQNYRAHHAKYLEYEKRPARVLSRRKRSLQDERAYRQRYPDKYRAHNAVNNAIRDGKLARLPCIVCGAEAEAHHPNYSKPLDVMWLCRYHHRVVEGRAAA